MLSQGAALKADTIIVSVSKQINKQLYNENCSNFHFRFSGIETQRINGEAQVCHNSEKRGMSNVHLVNTRSESGIYNQGGLYNLLDTTFYSQYNDSKVTLSGCGTDVGSLRIQSVSCDTCGSPSALAWMPEEMPGTRPK